MASQGFAELWSQHSIEDSAMDSVHVKLPGRVARFERITFGLLERYDLRLILHVPEIPALPGPARPGTELSRAGWCTCRHP